MDRTVTTNALRLCLELLSRYSAVNDPERQAALLDIVNEWLAFVLLRPHERLPADEYSLLYGLLWLSCDLLRSGRGEWIGRLWGRLLRWEHHPYKIEPFLVNQCLLHKTRHVLEAASRACRECPKMRELLEAGITGGGMAMAKGAKGPAIPADFPGLPDMSKFGQAVSETDADAVAGLCGALNSHAVVRGYLLGRVSEEPRRIAILWHLRRVLAMGSDGRSKASSTENPVCRVLDRVLGEEEAPGEVQETWLTVAFQWALCMTAPRQVICESWRILCGLLRAAEQQHQRRYSCDPLLPIIGVLVEKLVRRLPVSLDCLRAVAEGLVALEHSEESEGDYRSFLGSLCAIGDEQIIKTVAGYYWRLSGRAVPEAIMRHLLVGLLSDDPVLSETVAGLAERADQFRGFPDLLRHDPSGSVSPREPLSPLAVELLLARYQRTRDLFLLQRIVHQTPGLPGTHLRSIAAVLAAWHADQLLAEPTERSLQEAMETMDRLAGIQIHS